MLLGLEVENFRRAYRWEREGWMEGEGGLLEIPILWTHFFLTLIFRSCSFFATSLETVFILAVGLRVLPQIYK